MYKKSTSILSIVAQSFSIFLKKLPAFLKYLAYPVLGQLAGLMVCFSPFLISPNPNNVNILFVLFCAIAGLILFCHAFWKCLLVMGGLVLISKQIIENEPLQEFDRYTEIFSKRTKPYIAYILLTSFLIPILLFLAAAVVFFAFTFIFKGADFGITLPSNTVSQVSAFLAQKGLNVSVSAFVNIFITVVLGMIVSGIILVLAASIFSVSTEAFVLNPNLSPVQSILKGAKYSIRNFFPNLGLVFILFTIGLVIGQILELVVVTPIFNTSLYEKYEAYKDIISILKFQTETCLGLILVPFSTLCYTWWYLRMDKEYQARITKED